MKHILIDGKALSAGDVLYMNLHPLRIENISEPVIIQGQQQRWCYGTNLESGQIEPLVLSDFSVHDFKVVGGAKWQAAQRDPGLTETTVSGARRWTGGER